MAVELPSILLGDNEQISRPTSCGLVPATVWRWLDVAGFRTSSSERREVRGVFVM